MAKDHNVARITLSALGPSIAVQLQEQGLIQTTGPSVEMLDRISDAITLAHIKGCLTEAETDRARRRLVKMLKVRPDRDADGYRIKQPGECCDSPDDDGKGGLACCGLFVK
jgi:hypothetical protein